MENTDELIAKLKLAERIKKEEAEKKKLQENENSENKITIDEVISQIREKGEVTIADKLFKFEIRSFFNNKLRIPIVKYFFEEKINDENTVSLVNSIQGITFNASYIGKGAFDKSFEEFKKGMIYGFKQMKFKIEWLEEGTININSQKVYYGTYKTYTGAGEMYNMVFYKNYKGTLLMGTFNCFYKDIEQWKLIIKASTMLISLG